MKKLKLTSVLALVLLILNSCASEEISMADSLNGELLKSYEVKRDIDGEYYLDFTTTSTTKVERTDNVNTNSSEFHLYQSDLEVASKVSKDINLVDSKLQVAFFDTQKNNNPSITIIDDNIVFAKGKNNMLKNYSIKSISDNSYELNFRVSKNVVVDFVYNEALETYDIHLEQGDSKKRNYTRTFEKEEGKALKIDFVNHDSNESAKETEESAPRKPRIIIDSINE